MQVFLSCWHYHHNLTPIIIQSENVSRFGLKLDITWVSENPSSVPDTLQSSVSLLMGRCNLGRPWDFLCDDSHWWNIWNMFWTVVFNNFRYHFCGFLTAPPSGLTLFFNINPLVTGTISKLQDTTHSLRANPLPWTGYLIIW